MKSRRAFRPAWSDCLEERLALSHAGAAVAAHRAHPAAQVAAIPGAGIGSLGFVPGLSPRAAPAGGTHGNAGIPSRVSGPASVAHPGGRGFFLATPVSYGPAPNLLLSTPFASNFRAGGSSTPGLASSSFFTPPVTFRNGFNLGGLGFNGFGFPGFGSSLLVNPPRLLASGLNPTSFGFNGMGYSSGLGPIPGIGLSAGVGFVNGFGVNNAFGPLLSGPNTFGAGAGSLALTQGVRFDNALGLNPGLAYVTGVGGPAAFGFTNPFSLLSPFNAFGASGGNGFNSLGMAI